RSDVLCGGLESLDASPQQVNDLVAGQHDDQRQAGDERRELWARLAEELAQPVVQLLPALGREPIDGAFGQVPLARTALGLDEAGPGELGHDGVESAVA